jgi:hypothetical protein
MPDWTPNPAGASADEQRVRPVLTLRGWKVLYQPQLNALADQINRQRAENVGRGRVR